MKWEVILEGEFQLLFDGCRRSISNRKLKACIAIFALRDFQAISRQELSRLLWEQDSIEVATVNLRQLLTQARKLLGSDCVISDSVMVQFVSIQRIRREGEIMPGHMEAPFRNERNQKKNAEVVQHFLATFEYVAAYCSDSLPDYTLGSYKLFEQIPATQSVDLIQRSIDSTSLASSQRAELLGLQGYFYCLTSDINSAERRLSSAYRYASLMNDAKIKRQVRPLLLHCNLLRNDIKTAESYLDQKDEFAHTVFTSHAGLIGTTRKLLKSLLMNPQSISKRQQAVLALFCLTFSEPELGESTLSELQLASSNAWDLNALIALDQGLSSLKERNFEKALEGFRSCQEWGRFGQCLDFVRYGLEGEATVAKAMGDSKSHRSFSSRAQIIRSQCGFRETHWDLARTVQLV